MKKIGHFFMKILKALYSVFDKIIITPISRLIYLVNKRFNKGNNSNKS